MRGGGSSVVAGSNRDGFSEGAAIGGGVAMVVAEGVGCWSVWGRAGGGGGGISQVLGRGVRCAIANPNEIGRTLDLIGALAGRPRWLRGQARR